VVLEVASEVDSAVASTVVGVGAGIVAAVASGEVADSEEGTVVALTAMALPVMRPQALVLVMAAEAAAMAVVTGARTEARAAVVGMTHVLRDAHMMTDMAVAAVATAIDTIENRGALEATWNPYDLGRMVGIVTETTTGPPAMMTGNATMKAAADMTNPGRSVATKAYGVSLIHPHSRSLQWWVFHLQPAYGNETPGTIVASLFSPPSLPRVRRQRYRACPFGHFDLVFLRHFFFTTYLDHLSHRLSKRRLSCPK